ncbi:hypothetical protein DSL64_22810 [Dyadobacter luteus]|uniref:RagB/SusD domain-containing protein n=1 Tax=Dyadobacter luteus TaxID=2259619 RepID=A0A3D8Y5E7_9BACT|nr:RagB/SusD family nutrient uptake outer membrane protein [Dyadobacter luteus]REA57768.1 hypothetical protein DSL64_22810 [Dyadobacter luteus]
MNRSYIKYITAFSLALLASCQRLLDKEPQNRISLEATFQDYESAKVALTGAYSSLYAMQYYNGYRMLYPDITGGNVKYSKITDVIKLYDTYNFSASSDDTEMNGTYTYLYSILNNLNNIIYYSPGIPNGTEVNRNRLIADAMVLRALVHLDLLLMFAQPYNFTADASHPGIAINLEPILIANSIRARSTVAESYTAIENDLLSGIELLAKTQAIFAAGNTKNYVSINMAKALLARVYMHKGDWQKAYDYADEVIKTNSYALYNNAAYVNAWTKKNTSEAIFEISVPNNTSGTTLGSYFDVTTINASASAAWAASTSDLLTLYSATDVRNQSSFYNPATVNSLPYFFCKKYSTGGVLATGIKVLRISEMYLIRAESAAELGNNTTALADLNTIIQRADTEATSITISGKQELIDRIMLERRKELNYEGFALFDISRRKQNLVRQDCVAIKCGLTYPSDLFVLPLPASTVLVNPLMKQNPGY